MKIGADYYPEHWPKDRWQTDAQLMQQAHFTVTRLAEFSWVKLEPRPGEYDFAWLDQAIDTLAQHGVQAILCTPTATMPKWMYDAYPEVTAVTLQGSRMPFGNRQHNCFTSPVYREFSRKITRALAQHYHDNPHVIGWQLDNEFWGPICYCEHCENAFREWLQAKYKTLDALNQAYGTIFWSQSYTDWSQVHIPRHEHPNLSLALDHRRFHSDQIIRFAQEQIDILRQLCPGQFITHNFMGWAPLVNYYQLAQPLDFVSFDYYYNGGKWEDRFDAYLRGASALDLTRGLADKNFMIMENSAGPIGWETFSRNLRPGELRRITYQNIAHGCDAQMWFRWRTCRFGTEQYWHGLLGHDGRPGRRYQEASQVAGELQQLFGQLEGTTVPAKVAIISDYDDRWALELQPNAQGFDYLRGLMPYYRALRRRGIDVDFIPSDRDFGRYALLIAPFKYLCDQQLADRLAAFTAAGGRVLTTCRSGVKNLDTLPHACPLPGPLAQLCGIDVTEYEAIDPQEHYTVRYDDQLYPVTTLADWITPTTAQVLAAYTQDGVTCPAVTLNQTGRGQVLYVGTLPDDALADALVGRLLEGSGIRQYTLPQHCELATRQSPTTRFTFIINHTTAPMEVDAQANQLAGDNLADGRLQEGRLMLPANGVAILRQRL